MIHAKLDRLQADIDLTIESFVDLCLLDELPVVTVEIATRVGD